MLLCLAGKAPDFFSSWESVSITGLELLFVKAALLQFRKGELPGCMILFTYLFETYLLIHQHECSLLSVLSSFGLKPFSIKSVYVNTSFMIFVTFLFRNR